MEELTRSQKSNRGKKEIKRILLEDYGMKFKKSFIEQAIYRFQFYWTFDKLNTVHDTTDFLLNNIDKFVWYLFFAESNRKLQSYYYEKERELNILD